MGANSLEQEIHSLHESIFQQTYHPRWFYHISALATCLGLVSGA
jgi:hypothetical protein